MRAYLASTMTILIAVFFVFSLSGVWANEGLLDRIKPAQKALERGDYDAASKILNNVDHENVYKKFEPWMAAFASSGGSSIRELRNSLENLDIELLSDEEITFAYVLNWAEFLRNPKPCDPFRNLFFLILSLNGHSLSQYDLANVLMSGRCKGKKHDQEAEVLEEAVYWYTQADRAGVVEARAQLGIANLLGRGTDRDAEKGLQLLDDAAKSGSETAMHALGEVYKAGIGVRADRDTAQGYFKAAASLDHIPSQIALGELLIEKSSACNALAPEHCHLDEAKKWLREAANAGNAEAQFKLAIRLAKELSQGFDESMEWHAKAAAQGHAGAQATLGFVYWHGENNYGNVKRDCLKAIGLFQKAAARENRVALNFLGDAYMGGCEGFEKNGPLAISYWERSAALGDSRAMYSLARAYEIGNFVPRSMAQSRAWLQRAAEKGHEGARNRVKSRDFLKAENQEQGIALLLGLVALGVATAGDPTVVPGENVPTDYISNPPVPWEDVFN